MSLRAPSAVGVRQPQSWSPEINGTGTIHSRTQTEKGGALLMTHSLMVINTGSNAARAAC